MATVFSVKDPNPGVWFKFDESDPESGEILVRGLNVEMLSEIDKLCNKKSVEYKKGQRFAIIDPNEDLSRKMMWEYCIVDWKKLEDDDGKPIECDDEMKLRLMITNPGFTAFVGGCITLLNKQEEDRVARIRKNSLTEPKGSGKNRVVKGAEN